ncbi:MAG: aldo/keto reductase [Actinobacteria bacterium]|nr:MAG: aldo/keto reductase [Actinomycetota bacterium]
MKHRILGSSNLSVSVIGMGCWAIGGKKWGAVDDNASTEAVKKAYDLGVNFFDTADFYGFGHSEEILGKALSSHKDAIIATKVGLRWNNKGTIKHDLSADYVIDACEASLKRLNREVIDLYQIHWPDPDTNISNTIQALQTLVDQGKVRYVGACNLDLDQLKAISQLDFFVSYQDRLNLFRQKVKKDILPYCQEKHIAFIGYEPLFKGMLTGKFKKRPNFDKGDHRKYKGRFTVNFDYYKKQVDLLRDIAERHKLKTSQLALALLINNEGVTTVIPGAKTAKQVEENIFAAELDDKVLAALECEISEVFV